MNLDCYNDIIKQYFDIASYNQFDYREYFVKTFIYDFLKKKFPNMRRVLEPRSPRSYENDGKIYSVKNATQGRVVIETNDGQYVSELIFSPENPYSPICYTINGKGLIVEKHDYYGIDRCSIEYYDRAATDFILNGVEANMFLGGIVEGRISLEKILNDESLNPDAKMKIKRVVGDKFVLVDADNNAISECDSPYLPDVKIEECIDSMLEQSKVR